MGYREDYFKYDKGIKIPFKRGTYYRCVRCGGLFLKSDITVDHIIPKRKGGIDAVCNLQAMCRSCNSSKRDRNSNGEMATSLIRATVSGNLGSQVKSMAHQKLEDVLGVKYKRK